MRRLNFELKEDEKCYSLWLNGSAYCRYPKTKFSKQEAEDKANDIVKECIIKYGFERVRYSGVFVNN